MALAQLNHRELAVVLRSIRAAVEGPFFHDWEFHTLFGLERSELAAIAARWPNLDDSQEMVRLAIQNSFANLLGYPHDLAPLVEELVGESLHEVERVFRKWRASCPTSA